MKVGAPLDGLSENRAHSEQEPGTTREARNCRAEDPPSGREGIAQRSGLTNFSTATPPVEVAGVHPVRMATDLTYDVPVLDYAKISDANMAGTSEWKLGSSNRAANLVVTDFQEASYWIFGKDTLMKISADGSLVWCFSVPLLEETHAVRALKIDDANNLYVSSGADQDYTDGAFDPLAMEAIEENNRVWRIAQISDPEMDVERPQLAGEWSAGGFVEDVYLANGFVYLLQNRPSRYKADLVILSDFAVDSTQVLPFPNVLASRVVPYPAHSLAVNAIGEIIVSSEPNTKRLYDPKYPSLSKTSGLGELPGFWTWRRNLDNAQGRLWCEIDPAVTAQANGTAVTDLPDIDGLGRGFYFAASHQGTGTDSRTLTEPTFIERVLGDYPGIRFNGTDTGLQSLDNQSLDYRDRGGAQRTPWPSYGGSSGTPKVTDSTSAAFVFFLVVRLPATGSRGAIIAQNPVASGAHSVSSVLNATLRFALVANRPESESLTVAAEDGKITLFDYIRENAGDFNSADTPHGPLHTAGDVRQPREGDLLGIRHAPNTSADAAEPPIAIIAVGIDNQVDPTTARDQQTGCFLRINGMPIDRWEGSVRISDDPVTLGYSGGTGAGGGDSHGHVEGDLIRYICLARPDPLDITQEIILSTPRTGPKAQKLNIISLATAGTFTLTIHYPDGTADETTAGIAWNATAAQMLAALVALPGLGTAANIHVNGTDLLQVNGGLDIYFGWDDIAAKPANTGTYYGIDIGRPTEDMTGLTGLIIQDPFTDIDSGTAGKDLAHGALTDTEVELIEGQLAHEYGIQHLLPQPASGVPFAHPYAVNPPLDPDSVDPSNLLATDGVLSKYSTGDLSLVWTVTDTDAIGFDIQIDDNGDIYCLGPGSSFNYAKYLDSGDSVALDYRGTLGSSLPTNRRVKGAVDKDGRFYIPSWNGATTPPTMTVVNSGTPSDFEYDSSATSADVVYANAIALPREDLDYGSTVIERKEFAYIASLPNPPGGGADDFDTARKVRLVSVTHSLRPPRTTERIFVCNGDIKRDNGLGGYDTISGGGGVIDTSAAFVQGVRHQGKLYITDQLNTYVYDPKAGASGEVSLHVATDGGMVPQRAHFHFSWRGKLGWARLDDKPGFLQLSRSAKPSELNITPTPLFPGRAWKGSSSLDIGEMPDVINSIAPVSNTLLAIFGDKSIHYIQGEPTFGGQLTEASRNVGGAYGKCWAWDGEDRMFFMSNFGGIYALPVGGQPRPISNKRLKRRLQNIDFSEHYVHAEWNWLDDTVHFCLIPYSGTPSVVSHYVLDTKRERLSFWEDTHVLSRQPTCVGTLDGDLPQDRRMVFGYADGMARVWDPNASDDDGEPIDFSVIYPLTPSGQDTQFAFSELAVTLDREHDGAVAELIPAEDAAILDEDLKSAQIPLRPGMNPAAPDRMTGNYGYLRIRNGAPGSRCAVTEVKINGQPKGPRRTRHAD